MKLADVVPPSDLPGGGGWIPGLAVRAVFVGAGVLLSLVDYRLTGWLGVGIVLSVGVWSPQSLLGWGLILFLAAGELAHHAGLGWRLWSSWRGFICCTSSPCSRSNSLAQLVQPAVFVGPVLRVSTIQATLSRSRSSLYSCLRQATLGTGRPVSPTCASRRSRVRRSGAAPPRTDAPR